ncbi:hypothetical protein [Sphingomonas sp. ERG5]|uniref:hypothetical protein n=1 Tax=Sphingomonas sp. ERG5 TaxID=1381597 RepID=UPI001364CC57|nr:hypothetical protein [Sphingomonas sp. ERG5]
MKNSKKFSVGSLRIARNISILIFFMSLVLCILVLCAAFPSSFQTQLKNFMGIDDQVVAETVSFALLLGSSFSYLSTSVFIMLFKDK